MRLDYVSEIEKCACLMKKERQLCPEIGKAHT